MTDESVVHYSAGWIDSDFTATGPAGDPIPLPPMAVRNLTIEDARQRRDEAEAAADRENAEQDFAFQMRKQGRPDGTPYAETHAQVLARAAGIMAAQDRAAERYAAQHPEINKVQPLPADTYAQRFRGLAARGQGQVLADIYEDRDRRAAKTAEDRRRVDALIVRYRQRKAQRPDTSTPSLAEHWHAYRRGAR